MAQTSRSNPAIGGAVPTQCDDGQRRHRTEIHASEVVFLDSKGGNGNGDASDIEQPVGASPF